MELSQIRELVDNLDKQALTIISQRLALSESIARAKMEKGLPLVDRQREDDLMQDRIEYGKRLDLQPDFVKKLMILLMEESKSKQKSLLDKTKS